MVVLVIKNPPANGGHIKYVGSIPGLGISPAGGHGNSFQYSCLENPWTEGNTKTAGGGKSLLCSMAKKKRGGWVG